MIPDHIPASISAAEASARQLQRVIAPLTEKRAALEHRRTRLDNELATQSAARTEALYRGEDVGKLGARIRELTDERDSVAQLLERVVAEIQPLEQQLEEATVLRAQHILLRQAWEADERLLAAQREMNAELQRIIDGFPSLVRAVRQARAAVLAANTPITGAHERLRPPARDLFASGAQGNLVTTIENVALHGNPDWLDAVVGR